MSNQINCSIKRSTKREKSDTENTGKRNNSWVPILFLELPWVCLISAKVDRHLQGFYILFA